jgi:2'-5' RNA ligase
VNPFDFAQLLESGDKSYSCTMLMMPEEVCRIIQQVQDDIDEDDLAGDGLETEYHTTIMYGTHTDDLDEIKEALRSTGIKEVRFKIGDLTSFPPSVYSDGASVLKYDVESDDLNELHEALAKLKCTESFKNYHAHCTVAYVDSGVVDRYTGKPFPKRRELTSDQVMFSTSDRKKTTFKLSDP